MLNLVCTCWPALTFQFWNHVINIMCRGEINDCITFHKQLSCHYSYTNTYITQEIQCYLKVIGESSIEIFITKNKVVYVSPTVHVSNKLSTATEMPSLRYRNKKILFSHRPPHADPLDKSAHQILSSWQLGRNRNLR